MNFHFVRTKDSVRKTVKFCFLQMLEKGEIELQAVGIYAVSTASKSAAKTLAQIFKADKTAVCITNYSKTEINGETLPTVTIRMKMT